ncbi:hypothetical protein EDD18DRAFT_383429 [Armillaria luteobubalina]|uniref:Uncharacterized protein n=1 Tax=Armillaria luteobubalina TaxID=153913 RepID=A0AA39Q106_9AGAR|nr:hypothetical protein EDD18DRAFT_383429 [Armillaria luteobubalina]
MNARAVFVAVFCIPLSVPPDHDKTSSCGFVLMAVSETLHQAFAVIQSHFRQQIADERSDLAHFRTATACCYNGDQR